MRIISGTLRGRRLAPIPGRRIRPSSDRLRESVFNILGPRVVGVRVLDLYAGTGAFGIEALSRGAASAVFMDNHPQSIQILTRNVNACSLARISTILKRDVLRGLRFLEKSRAVFDLVFLDPPYDAGLIEPTVHLLDETGAVAAGGLVVVEHSLREVVPDKDVHLERTDQRRYGKSLVSFYESVV